MEKIIYKQRKKTKKIKTIKVFQHFNNFGIGIIYDDYADGYSYLLFNLLFWSLEITFNCKVKPNE